MNKLCACGVGRTINLSYSAYVVIDEKRTKIVKNVVFYFHIFQNKVLFKWI